MSMAKKLNKGRQKITMTKIKNPSHRQVTFSKRRLGLFKKASEICTLCGVEAVIVVFSPGEKIFSFGHPDVEPLVDQFINRGLTQVSGTLKLEPGQQNNSFLELNAQLTQALDYLEVEKKKGEALSQLRKASQTQWWWEGLVEKLGLEELEVLRASMEDLKKNIANQAMILNNTSNSAPTFEPFYFNKSMEAKPEFPYFQVDSVSHAQKYF